MMDRRSFLKSMGAIAGTMTMPISPFKKFGTASMFLDGTSTDWDFGGDFTVEFRTYQSPKLLISQDNYNKLKIVDPKWLSNFQPVNIKEIT